MHSFSPIVDAMQTRANVRITVRERGKLVTTRESHNVFTNTGRAWQALLYGSPDYNSGAHPTPHVQTRVKFIGFGCGGALQNDTRFARRQQELITVTHLEDPVPFSIGANSVRRYLKELYPQRVGASINFPSPYRCCLVADVLESEISFIGNRTRVSNVEVGTLVPVSEIGLYLSNALPFFTHPSPLADQADPATANQMVTYNIFDPVPITPGSGMRVEWELRT